MLKVYIRSDGVESRTQNRVKYRSSKRIKNSSGRDHLPTIKLRELKRQEIFKKIRHGSWPFDFFYSFNPLEVF